MRRFGELEAVIMDRLWEWERPVLVREMVDALHDDRPLAYTTVMTVMENLYRKGWLRRERDGRAWRCPASGRRIMQRIPGCVSSNSARCRHTPGRSSRQTAPGLRSMR